MPSPDGGGGESVPVGSMAATIGAAALKPVAVGCSVSGALLLR
jgi:hypothetical protein